VIVPTPVDLRCEYLRDPLGVDVARPRLSWIIQHPGRDQRQTAFQIIVGSTSEMVAQEAGDLWDSGKVLSPETSGIRYGGSDLRSFQAQWWRVRWWDKDGIVSDWSEPARFEMGFLPGTAWKARWISKKDCKEFSSKVSVLLGEPLGDYSNAFTIYLRREFRLTKPIVRARAFVCGLGYYELRINGRKVGDQVLDPAQTDYKKLALYSTYDVINELAGSTKTRESGSFAVALILGNGRHIRSYGYDTPKALLQILIEYADGTTDDAATGSDWKASYGPLQENGLYFGERYDARLEMPGWDDAGFDDSKWEPAIEVQGIKPSAQLMPPIRVVRRLQPATHVASADGKHVYDFGQNFAGWVKLSLRGREGTEVTIRHAELLNEDGSLNTSTSQNAEATDIYVLRGEGIETYEPRFTYHGFRYVSLTATPSMPAIMSIEGCVVHSDVESIGEFSCSNSLLNRIHQNVLWGQLSNLMSIPTDCTQRDERQGWLGDAHLAAEESMLNFDLAAFYSMFLISIEFSQQADGSLPDTVPPYWRGLYPADPAWSSAFITLAWLVYRSYGDKDVLDRHFDSMKRYVDFLNANAEDHVITKLGKYGDWCPPGSIAPKRTPVELTSTWYYYHDTFLLSEIAGVLNRSEDQTLLATRAVAIKDAFNLRFLQKGEYAVNRFAPVDRAPGQTSNVLPLYLGMVPPDMKTDILKRLLHGVIAEQDFHLDTGILGTRYLLDVLTENGYGDVAYKVASQKSYPGWGYMVEEGATTLWERWEKIEGGGMNSHNHIMLGSVDAWFYRVVAGLTCLDPGWRRIRFLPPVFDGLDRAEAAVATVRGSAGIAWEKRENAFSLRVKIPVGAIGVIYVPLMWDRQSISETRRPLWRSGTEEGAVFDRLRMAGNGVEYVGFEFGSGEYDLIALPES
jgi:alpha-L-rhamnosidase